ncbi:MAG TPA: type II toxin-antitoxin system VapC family toxin [Vicinamibacterales bacterium]
MPGYAYLDASAITKLILPEAERSALETAMLEKDALFASRLALTECMRAALRYGQDPLGTAVVDVFRTFMLLDVSSEILRDAGHATPSTLRSLDAIHLASALSLKTADLEMVTYDDRLAEAARANGLTVVQPGRDSQP